MTPDIRPDEYKGAMQLNWNVGLLNDVFKWDNQVYTSGTYSKFQTVSWEYMIRIPTPWWIEPFLHHKSQHTMDSEQPTFVGYNEPVKFPVRDSVGVRIIFFERGKK